MPKTDFTPEYDFGGLLIYKVVVGPVDNNVYVVRCKETGESVLIDAANEHDRLLQLATELGVTRVIETHGHWDHIGAVTQMREAGFEVMVSSEDAMMLPSYDLLLSHMEPITFGRIRMTQIWTPGHTPGSFCFAPEGYPVLFTGDTLFPGGPGSTKFEGGDFPTIIRSIENEIFSNFPDETLILPGHGTTSTLGDESPNLQTWIDRGW
ncbi:MAG: MBL fold metallo-hydrolase [Acidimicrobiaceae bacterium]|nr:MBL fold metallo-hydrolase [Acidimicrobiaceae bacterium]